MIRVERVELPRQLAACAEQLTESLEKTDETKRYDRARGLWKSSAHRKQLVGPLRQLLREMAHGNRCCMYCCHDLSTDIDHFEPVSRNPLRTFDWLNHLLVCSACNSQYKKDRFPLDDNGVPLLIDPTREDPFDHLYLGLDTGEYTWLTKKGRVTWEVCGLDRADLPESRLRARNTVSACVTAWQQGYERGNAARMRLMERTIREQPFADVTQFMLRQALLPKAAAAFGFEGGDETLELLRLPELRGALLS